jgi:hypothetical protein
MDDLNQIWKEARQGIEPAPENVGDMIVSAMKKKKSVLFFHYGNIITLTVVLIMISAFFFFVAPFRDLLSWVGVGMMVVGLVIRILVEIYSAHLYGRIQITNDASTATNNTVSFYQFRKKVHGPLTISIVAIYIVGFYMLSPEFSKHIPMDWLIGFDLSVIPVAVILVWQIRKGILKEMATLSSLIGLKQQIDSINTPDDTISQVDDKSNSRDEAQSGL